MTRFSVATPSLTAGSYTVNWAVIGADGHTVTNSFSFSVDPAAVAASQ
jgi:methionine-rich copper-binding protein CopC